MNTPQERLNQGEQSTSDIFAAVDKDGVVDLVAPTNHEVEPQFNATGFVNLLVESLDDCDDPEVQDAILTYASLSGAEFVFPDDDSTALSAAGDTIEARISTFIDGGFSEDGSGFNTLFLNTEDLFKISAMYTGNNLMAFTQYVGNGDGFTPGEGALDSIYRYRAVLKRLEEHAVFLGTCHSNSSPDRHIAKPMHGWAGDVRDYGTDSGGVHVRDFNKFDPDGEERRYNKLFIAGEIVRVTGFMRNLDE